MTTDPKSPLDPKPPLDPSQLHPLPAGQTLEQAIEEDDDRPFEPTEGTPSTPTLGALWQKRISRRDALRGFGKTGLALSLSTSAFALAACDTSQASSFNFIEIEHGVDETHHVAPDHKAKILIRWGDPLFADSPAFDPENQSAAAQLKQFGYNNDYVGFTPLPLKNPNSDRALLCVNHEYTTDRLMHPGLATAKDPRAAYTKEIAEISMAAHGGSIVEIARTNGEWETVSDSPYNRRISTLATQMTIDGPASGHPRLQTSADPSGTKVTGTLNNCAGGMTPWGTYLMSEENFHMYFSGNVEGHPEERNYKRLGLPRGIYPWGAFDKRFHIEQEPNEANRFGWIVEVDPYDPTSTPVKHTALGRFKHEGCETNLTGDGHVVVYSGDDQRFEHLYKFISSKKVHPTNRAENMDLLSEGTLYTARFNEDGTGEWVPLVYGTGELTEKNGFSSQADVMIECRYAADLVGATQLDRPEDVQPNIKTGKVYVALTNNKNRPDSEIDGPNPRGPNLWGQIVELTYANNDAASTEFTWDLVVTCGDPNDEAVKADWHASTSPNGWFACPDNLAVDPKGRLWVATDQGHAWSQKSGTADGIWSLETDGELRGLARMFFRVPVGAEMCGPCFSPSGEALFVAVQHPGSDGTGGWKPFARASTYDDPATRWPDFEPKTPPRPSLVVISRDGGGQVG